MWPVIGVMVSGQDKLLLLGQLHVSLGRSSGLLTADSVTHMEQFQVYLEVYFTNYLY